MNLIKELRPGAGYDIKAEIIEIQPIKKIWKCFDCGGKGSDMSGLMKVCPKCNAIETKETNKGVWIQEVTSAVIKDESGQCYLDLWKKDITKYKVGDIVEVTNCFVKKSTTGNINISKGKLGAIELIKNG